MPHRKRVNIGLYYAYKEGRPAVVITPISSVVVNSDNCCINRSIYCITFLVRRYKSAVIFATLAPQCVRCNAGEHPVAYRREQMSVTYLDFEHGNEDNRVKFEV